jgi:hypothetical protein
MTTGQFFVLCGVLAAIYGETLILRKKSRKAVVIDLLSCVMLALGALMIIQGV